MFDLFKFESFNFWYLTKSSLIRCEVSRVVLWWGTVLTTVEDAEMKKKIAFFVCLLFVCACSIVDQQRESFG